MGDISEMRGLIVAGCFLGLFAMLWIWMPPQLLSGSNMQQMPLPESFTSNNIILYNQTYFYVNFTWYSITYPGTGYQGFWGANFDIGASHFVFDVWNTTNNWVPVHPSYFACDYVDDLGIFRGSCDWATDENNYGHELYVSDVNAIKASGHDLVFTLSSSETPSFMVIMGYDETIFATPQAALEQNSLVLSIGQTVEQQGSSINAWTVLSKVLTFQYINANPYLNLIVALPIWIAVAYMVFIFALRVVGAVFGGGGA